MHKTAQEVLHLLLQRKETFAAAESCTGGLLAERFTELPGASQVFVGGVVSYTNSVKHTVLGVPQTLLDTYGAVSAPVAEAMAEGMQALVGADWALSVTGLAGPAGDDEGHPIGTVFVGLAGRNGTAVTELHLSGDRTQIRSAAANYAFDALRKALTQPPIKGEERHG